MNRELRLEIQSMLSAHCGEHVTIEATTPLGGGCINRATKLTVNTGRHWFLKTNVANSVAMFRSEQVGLEALGKSPAFRIPEVVGSGVVGDDAYLLLEYISLQRPNAPDFSEDMARRLASLHDTHAQQFGFEVDNFLGATPQPNPRTSHWIQFWIEHRMEHQLRLAHGHGFGGQLQTYGAKLIKRMNDWLTDGETLPCLIHGDLWSGNYFVDEQGRPVLLDPAPYFASREAEFGMTTLFGGFDDRFYAAYNEICPMSEGADDRIALYRLYHLLNHLNLFGASYLDGCLQILKKYA